MLYEVRAAQGEAGLITLMVEAADASQARQQALRQRLTPVSIKPHRPIRAQRGSAFDLALFAEELQMLLNAGLPVIEALDGLGERHADPDTAAVYRGLADRLRQGDRLSAAMSQQAAVFPGLFVGIVRAAESTSDLPQSLAKYVAYEGHLRHLRERISSAALYPLILLVAGMGVTLFLMAYVVPRFASVYQSGGRSLPLVTQVLFDTGRFMQDHLPLLIISAAALAIWVWRRLTQSRRAGGAWLQALSLVPGASSHVATIEMARLYRTLGMLLQGGLPVREALMLADSVLFGARRQALSLVRQQVEGGMPLSASLSDRGLCTPLAQRLLQVGERSGQLGVMLDRAAAFHEHETALWVERFGKTFGPALMVLISLIVGLVVVFLYIPVFDLAGGLQ